MMIAEEVQDKLLDEYIRTRSLATAWRTACAIADALALTEGMGTIKIGLQDQDSVLGDPARSQI